VLWQCWLGVRKSIQPVKIEWWGWCGYLSGERCRLFAHGPADVAASQPQHLFKWWSNWMSLYITMCHVNIQMCLRHHSLFTPIRCSKLLISNKCQCLSTNKVHLYIGWAHVLSECKVKGKVFPYSLPSVGPGADPGVQAVSPQVTWSESRYKPGSSLPLLSAGLCLPS